jgi:NADPH:quinone reductase-like Zn-dependent oxidoreductase
MLINNHVLARADRPVLLLALHLEYIQTEGSLVWKVPQNIAYEEAAALGGIGPHTAFQALYLRLAIPHPSTPAASPSQSIFIYGGSTSVGLYAIQLAKLSGLNVITSCSPRNFDLVKSLGATDAYDYSDASNPAKIKAKYPTLALGFDCIAEKGSTAFLAQSLG